MQHYCNYKRKFYYICGVKQTSIILLLTLLLLPIIWNGITLFHFVVEHTHTFCQEDLAHAHSNTEDCLTIFQLSENHNQLPSPTKSEFKALKQYLASNLYLAPILPYTFQQINFINPSLTDDAFSKDVFQPPIFA